MKPPQLFLSLIVAIPVLPDLIKSLQTSSALQKSLCFSLPTKPILRKRRCMQMSFMSLGLGEVYPISAENGSGTGELLDDLVKTFPTEGVEDPNAGIPKISILGRPNVGKSSLLNALLGTERSIVTDEAGTTRDAIHSHYKMYGNDFILIDTAGIRKKSKVRDDVEFYPCSAPFAP
jgi:GTP-binding protein